jgi:hypothetical protein
MGKKTGFGYRDKEGRTLILSQKAENRARICARK